MSGSTRRIVAVHEAAHAVVWAAMGLRVSHCVLLTIGRGTMGETVLVEPNVPRRHFVSAAAGLVAGEIAERRAWMELVGEDPATAAITAYAGAAGDREVYARDLSVLAPLTREVASIRAEEIVRKRWRRILRLSRTLDRIGRLEGTRIHRW